MFKEYNYTDVYSILFELKNQKAAIIKTDTIIGIISLEENLIYKIKKRSKSKKIIKFVKNYNLIPFLTKTEKDFLNHFWPGPITIIKNSISYRCPNDDFLLLLLNFLNEFYCSSANLSNKDPIQEVQEANYVFDVDKNYYNLFLVNTNTIPNNIPSTIIDLDTWKIIREGSNLKEVKEYLLNNIFNKNKKE